jgi:hypothetical protein
MVILGGREKLPSCFPPAPSHHKSTPKPPSQALSANSQNLKQLRNPAQYPTKLIWKFPDAISTPATPTGNFLSLSICQRHQLETSCRYQYASDTIWKFPVAINTPATPTGNFLLFSLEQNQGFWTELFLAK